MFAYPRNMYIVLGVALFLITGCMTKGTGTWKNSDYQGPAMTSIMVVGLTPDPTNRLKWENMMAERLGRDGVKTLVTSLAEFASDREIDKQQIIDYVTDKGIEGVLVTRLVDTKEEQVYSSAANFPSYYYNFNAYYSYSLDLVARPGYVRTRTVLLLETNLYNVKDLELIWSMSSDTFDPRSINQLVESVSKKVVQTLQKDNLIKK